MTRLQLAIPYKCVDSAASQIEGGLGLIKETDLPHGRNLCESLPEVRQAEELSHVSL